MEQYMYKGINGGTVLVDHNEISAVKGIDKEDKTQITLKSGAIHEIRGVFHPCVTENGHFVLRTDEEIAVCEKFATIWFLILIIAIIIMAGYLLYRWLFM